MEDPYLGIVRPDSQGFAFFQSLTVSSAVLAVARWAVEVALTPMLPVGAA